jgi:hypothetical protein
MSEDKEVKDRWFTKQTLMGALLTLVGGLLLWVITHYLTDRADVTALCLSSSIDGQVYSSKYVDQLSAEIESRSAKGRVADSFATALLMARLREDQIKLTQSDASPLDAFDKAEKAYEPFAKPEFDTFRFNKTDAQVTGQLKCLVKNTGQTKANDVQISFPSTAITLLVQGKPIDFDSGNPLYKLPSLNPGDSFTVVAQYGGYFDDSAYTLPPALTFADGVTNVQMVRPPYRTH